MVFILLSEIITLKDGIEILKKRNYDVLINFYEVEKARGNYIQAKQFYNPNFSISYSSINYDPKLRAFYDDNNTQFSAGINWDLIDISGKRFYSIQASYSNWIAQEYLFRSSLREIIIQFINQFFQTLSDKEYLNYLKDDFSNYETFLDILSKKYEIGSLSYVDYLKFKFYKLELENAIKEAQLNYENDLRELSFLLGGGNYEPSIKNDTILESLEINELLKKAYENRSDLKAFKNTKDFYDYELKLYKAYLIPDIYFQFQYDPIGTEYTPRFGIGLSFDLPFFDRKQGFINYYQAQIKQVEILMSKTIENIKLDIETS